MNRKQFFQWMNDPASLNPESQADLEVLIRNYPFFQTARLLNLLNLKLLGDYRFEHELRKVAALSADRARLREWLIKLEETGVENIKHVKKEKPAHTNVIEQEKENHLSYLEEQIKASLQEIALKKSRLNELLEEKNALAGPSELQPEETGRQEKVPAFRPLPKDDLLEEFIRESGNRAAGRANFFNPEETAWKSIEDNEDVLSETLARLIAAQGKKDKAMKIYQKLMLKYPQKSSYFAAQIEKLRKEP